MIKIKAAIAADEQREFRIRCHPENADKYDVDYLIEQLRIAREGLTTARREGAERALRGAAADLVVLGFVGHTKDWLVARADKITKRGTRCLYCNGSGESLWGNTCGACGGHGNPEAMPAGEEKRPHVGAVEPTDLPLAGSPKGSAEQAWDEGWRAAGGHRLSPPDADGVSVGLPAPNPYRADKIAEGEPS